MNIYIVNDTSSFHAGSKAAMDSLRGKIHSAGHEIIGSCPRLEEPDVDLLIECDALIVNGEGTMRDEEKNWETGRIEILMNFLLRAKLMKKKSYLINTVWCNMSSGWADTLKRLDQVTVREPSSRDEMMKSGITPEVFLGLSYSCPIEGYRGIDFTGQTVIGSFYPKNTPDRVDHTHPLFKGMPRLGLGGSIDNYEIADWSVVINSLSTANFYITGQHHGVYAACKARTPFVAIRVNTHKLTGLLRWAESDIPIAENGSQVKEIMDWAMTHKDSYERLFDWMEKQPSWELKL
jgi:hypothetical protein